MEIEINKLVPSRVSLEFIQYTLKASAKILGSQSKQIDNLSIAIVSQKEIQKINREYRGIDQPTDVLSFEEPPEIIVCWAVLKKQAKTRKLSQKEVLKELLVHGFLHILGYDHQQEKDFIKMDKISQKILKKLDEKKI